MKHTVKYYQGWIVETFTGKQDVLKSLEDDDVMIILRRKRSSTQLLEDAQDIIDSLEGE